MIELYTEEFIKIVEYILNKRLGFADDRDTLLVKKAVVNELMDNNRYEKNFKKFKVWKSLHWIQTDNDNFTKIVRTDNGTLRRMIVIDLKVFRVLKELLPE